MGRLPDIASLIRAIELGHLMRPISGEPEIGWRNTALRSAVKGRQFGNQTADQGVEAVARGFVLSCIASGAQGEFASPSAGFVVMIGRVAITPGKVEP
jgi:hypothetical protein